MFVSVWQKFRTILLITFISIDVYQVNFINIYIFLNIELYQVKISHYYNVEILKQKLFLRCWYVINYFFAKLSLNFVKIKNISSFLIEWAKTS